MFKKHYNDKSIENKAMFERLFNLSKLYSSYMGTKEYYGKDIQKYLYNFRQLKQNTILPFLYKIFEKYEAGSITRDTVDRTLSYLNTYLVRKIICEETKDLSDFMSRLYFRSIDDKNEKFSYEKMVTFMNETDSKNAMPNDDKFKKCLMGKKLYNNNACKFVLYSIENSEKEQINIENLMIEHIMPQTLNDKWRLELGNDYEKIHKKFIHNLGNLTITATNSELGNKTFFEKKKIYKESKANILNKYILECDNWNEKSILERSDILSDKIIELFPYFDLNSNKSDIKNQEYEMICLENIDLNIDVSYTKPYNFKLDNNDIKVNSWRYVLEALIKYSYNLDSDKFKKLVNDRDSIKKEKIKYISKEKNFINARLIENTDIYYETNLSANNILKFIVNLVEIFGINKSKVTIYVKRSSNKKKSDDSVAKKVYNYIIDLISRNKIDETELEKLTQKDYCKKYFGSISYPVIAYSRSAYKNNSSKYRYRADPIILNGKKYFVSTEFYDSNRKHVEDWYKSHF